MKKLLIVLLAAFFAVSCSMQVSDKTGSLTLSGARGVVTDLAGADADVRYSLTRNGKTIPLNGQSVLEVGAFDTVTIEGLIPGDGYELAVSVGNQAGNNFDVDYYGYSATFAISEGTNSAVNVTLQNAPDFTWLTSSGGNSSAAVVGTDMYILDGNGVGSFDAGGDIPDEIIFTSTDLSVNSLSKGKLDNGFDALWLNTTTGLYREAKANRLNSSYSGNVLFSRAINVGGDGDMVGIYSGSGSNIGFLYNDGVDIFSGPWENAADFDGIEEFLSEITQDVIKGVAINQDNSSGFFYVVTPLGTVIGSETSSSVSDLFTFDDGIAESIWLKLPGGLPINVVSTAANRVYTASTIGLYTAVVNTNTNVGQIPYPEAFSFVPITAGRKIVALESIRSQNGVLTAAVTDDNFVFLIENETVLETFPAATGIPLNAKPVLYDNNGFLHLILSGSNGSIDYNTELIAFSEET